MGLSSTEVTFTRHALHRILDMGLDAQDVVRCASAPDLTRKCARHPEFTYFHSDQITLSVVERPDGSIRVITVLWRTPEQWQTDLERGEYAGRKLRRQSRTQLDTRVPVVVR
ncbi:hypothetical protein ACIBCN_18805 [Nocardia sp. NPDC051052]|uniref:hypothetical protein n=1 Tax=Nocardia sp. NPDC051052 TaxID=3364322 RepID=UPI0037BB0B9C